MAGQEWLRMYCGQAVRHEAEVEGAGPGHRGLRNHSNGDEHRLVKSYRRDISKGIPGSGLCVFGRGKKVLLCFVFVSWPDRKSSILWICVFVCLFVLNKTPSGTGDMKR